jgi:S1-C subfamily serine protease
MEINMKTRYMLSFGLVVFLTAFMLLLITIPVLFSGCVVVETQTSTVNEQNLCDCDYISRKQRFLSCLACAEAGDAEAAFNIAKIYEKGQYFSMNFSTGEEGLKIKKDRTAAFHWYKVAADLGHEDALREVFDSYYFGQLVTENKALAKSYLNKSANMGHEWAMLLSADWSEESEPEKAIDLYLKLARKDNCHAKASLAEIYLKGNIVPQDLCKSYFWALLANAGGFFRKSDCHQVLFSSFTCSCSYAVEKNNIEKKLDSEYILLVQNEASKWQVGQIEPDLPRYFAKREKPSIVKIIPPDSIKLSELKHKEKPLEWIPAVLELNKRLGVVLTPSKIFDLVDPFVWTVISASTIENLKSMNKISLASAVAVSKNILLTNYHVIDKRPYVIIKHGEQIAEAKIYAGDKRSDRCILIVKDIKLKPVKGFREYNSLSVGESVFSVGSPQGLENTLGQGIISGKRELDEQKIIQTTAQISQGSSGGGLFDSSGNLIGITTFKVLESEGLNFAIPIEEFAR